MKKLFGGIAVAAMVALAVPVWAQDVTTKGEPVQDNPPGALPARQNPVFRDCLAASPDRR